MGDGVRLVSGGISLLVLALSAPFAVASGATRQARASSGGAQQSRPGLAVVTGASSNASRITGTPIDDQGFVFHANNAKLAINSTNAYAWYRYCSKRAAVCSARAYPGWQWIPVSRSFLRVGDQVLLQLDCSVQTATADARARKPIPVSWLYDVVRLPRPISA